MIFKIILDIFLSGALSLPGIQRCDVLQKKPTLGVTKVSSNFKEILQCMLRRIFFLNVIPVQTKQSYNEATDGKKYVVYHAIMKVCVALTFFSNILINLILPDPYTEFP